MNDYLLLMDGSSMLTTQFFGNLPREILFAKTQEEREPFFHKIMQTSGGIYTNAVYGFVRTLVKILAQQRPSHLAVAWDVSRDTFRRERYPDYKGNRSETMYPLLCQLELCQFLLEQFHIVQFMDRRYEADDFCGTIAGMLEDEIPVRIMTKDNDYLQLVTEKTNLWMMHSTSEKTNELYKKYGIDKAKVNAPERCFVYTPELVKQEFGVLPENINSLKGIQGDSSDNIKGVPGVGEMTARALIGYYHTVDALYADIHSRDKKGLEELKAFWKEKLGIKRSPLNFLTKSALGDLAGEKSARLSEWLATIKKDIPMEGVRLADLSLQIDFDQAKKLCEALEFKTIDFTGCRLTGFDGKTEGEGRHIDLASLPYGYATAWKDGLFSQDSRREFGKLQTQIGRMVFKTESQPAEEFLEKELTDLGEVEELFRTIGQEKPERLGFYLTEKEDGQGLWLSEDSAHNWYVPVQFLVTEQLLTKRMQELMLQCPDTMFVTFDWKRQLGWMNPVVYANVADMGIAAYLLNPLRGDYSPEQVAGQLQQLAENPQRLAGLSGRPASFIARIAAEYLLPELAAEGMERLYWEIEMPLVVTLYDMEQRGIRVERNALQEYSKELDRKIHTLEQKIYYLAGEEFNINSPKQLGIILFEKLRLPYGKKTKTGYSTSADVLERLRLEDPIVELILDYRQVAKLKSTYADGLNVFIGSDNRIHGKFHQTITATGRISSTDPNLQNIPVRMELGRQIRKAFIPEEGYVFLDADYSQIELRVLAHMSGDKRLIQAYLEKQDIHRITASQVFHTSFDEVTTQQRRDAKAVNFGMVYGISAFGLSQDLNISRAEAEDYMNQYFATYPGVRAYMDHLVEQGKTQGYVETLYGRRRPIPELESTHYVQRQFGERVAMNSPIQGTAADIIKIAMIKLNERLKAEVPESRLLLQIHDELLVETRKDQVPSVQAIMEEEMQQVATLLVPLVVEVKQGNNWYEAK